GAGRTGSCRSPGTPTPPCRSGPASSRRAGPDPQRERARTADLARGPRHRRGVGQGEPGDPAEPDLECDPQFHPRQVRAHAAVDTEAECRVPIDLAVDDNLTGPVELRRVPV